jgi:hypothetical protein
MGNTNLGRGPMSDEKESSDEGGSILDDGGIDTDERAGRSLGIEPDAEPDEDTKKEMEEEREKRLDPDNRPDGAEIDNSDRTFDVERGQFTDSDDYDESEPAPFSDPEDPNNPDNEGDGGAESGAKDEADSDDDESKEESKEESKDDDEND